MSTQEKNHARKVRCEVRVKVIAIVCVACFLGLLTQASAEIPRIVTFQGKLTDAEGNLLTGDYNLTFRIYDSETDGGLLWQETHPSASVTKGIFAVPLGVSVPLSLSFDAPYWISIQVESDDEMTPRQRLTSTLRIPANVITRSEGK